MPVKAPPPAAPARSLSAEPPAPVAEKPQPAPAPAPVVPAERELAAKLIAAKDRLARALEAEKMAKKANAEAAERLEGARAAVKAARLGILALAKEAGGSDVSDNFLYVDDEQAARVAKAGGLDALLAKL